MQSEREVRASAAQLGFDLSETDDHFDEPFFLLIDRSTKRPHHVWCAPMSLDMIANNLRMLAWERGQARGA